jgi:hypothetical protein
MMLEQFVFGVLIGIFIDVLWWRAGIQKYEKGHEMWEHYHFGLIIGIFGVMLVQPVLLGIMVILVLKESSQKHPFAIKSSHFISSTILGVSMAIVYIVVVVSQW